MIRDITTTKDMKAWLQGEKTSFTDITLENEEYEHEIIQAHCNQAAIGWDNFFKRRLSKQWSKIQ